MDKIKMNDREARLWQAIRWFELDDADAAFTFSDRLAREHGWSKTFSIRAIEEYKKFMFLVCATDQPLTPSQEVDHVWHLHLLYTRSYWKDFCGVVLKREVHHGPTKGGAKENAKFNDWYSQTLLHYEQKFGHAPPADLWPPPHLRFRPSNIRQVDLNKNWVIKKPI